MGLRVALALLVGVVLAVAVPASAQRTDETVTLAPGRTVLLKTVFDKERTYRITLSGVVTLTVSDVQLTIDPLFSYSGNCQSPSARTGIRLIDARGIDVFSPFSGVPAPKCRPDHTYSFTVNGPTPRTGVIDGRIKARNDITVNAARGDTASGSFTLTIEAEARPVATVVWGVRANKKKGLVGRAHLNGRGLMETLKIKEGALADRANLLPATTMSGEAPHVEYEYEGVRSRRLDMVITSGELIMQGAPGSASERFSVRLVLEVVRSNMPGCLARTKTRRGARGTMTLISYPRRAPDRFVSTFLDLPCGVDESWTDDDSDATIRVERVRNR